MGYLGDDIVMVFSSICTTCKFFALCRFYLVLFPSCGCVFPSEMLVIIEIFTASALLTLTWLVLIIISIWFMSEMNLYFPRNSVHWELCHLTLPAWSSLQFVKVNSRLVFLKLLTIGERWRLYAVALPHSISDCDRASFNRNYYGKIMTWEILPCEELISCQ